jgi:hypothetical protein
MYKSGQQLGNSKYKRKTPYRSLVPDIRYDLDWCKVSSSAAFKTTCSFSSFMPLLALPPPSDSCRNHHHLQVERPRRHLGHNPLTPRSYASCLHCLHLHPRRSCPLAIHPIVSKDKLTTIQGGQGGQESYRASPNMFPSVLCAVC